jgi:hypothetical protein
MTEGRLMRKSSRVLQGMLILPLFAWPLTATAHHSFTMFDQTKQVTITGTVTGLQWTNPHAYIEIDIPGEGGAVKHWSIEMGSPSILIQGDGSSRT